jgi:hypothetical protein
MKNVVDPEEQALHSRLFAKIGNISIKRPCAISRRKWPRSPWVDTLPALKVFAFGFDRERDQFAAGHSLENSEETDAGGAGHASKSFAAALRL